MEIYRSNAASIEAEYPPTASGWFEVNGHRLYWEQYGADARGTVVFLHHGLGSITAWNRQIEYFAVNGWNVLAFDRWGYGRSDPRPIFEDGFLWHDCQEVVALLDHLNLDRVSLLGHSDGGTIALMLAAENQDRVDRLVVAAAHIYVESKMEQGLANIAKAVENPAFVEALRRQHGQKAEALARGWTEHWQRVGYDGLDIGSILPQIECPTMVIQGEQDEHATPQHARDIADNVQDGRLWLIPGIGHMPIHEIPETFNQMVLDFLERDPLTPESSSADI